MSRPHIIMITHTDWKEPDPGWIRQPRLPFRRDSRQSWDNVMYDLGSIAHVDTIAIGCRGTFDPEAVAALPIARAAYDAMAHQPFVTFWGDTVGLPDIAHNLSGGIGGFDFASAQHIDWALEHFFGPFFEHFGDANLLRVDGKVLIPMWGIESGTGWGFINQWAAQRLLNAVDDRLDGAKFIVDKSWVELCPTLRAYGAHDWFRGYDNPTSYTTRLHNGIRTGVVVPGFADPDSDVVTIPHGGETARRALHACVAANCDYIVCEGATDYTEHAHWVVDSEGDDSKLKAIAEITHPFVAEGGTI